MSSSPSRLYSILQERNVYYLKRMLLKNSTLKLFQSARTLTWGWGSNYHILTNKRKSLNFSTWPFGTSGLGAPDIYLVSGSSWSGLSCLEAGSSASFIINLTQQNRSGSQVTESSAEHKPMQNVRKSHHTNRMWSFSAAF